MDYWEAFENIINTNKDMWKLENLLIETYSFWQYSFCCYSHWNLFLSRPVLAWTTLTTNMRERGRDTTMRKSDPRVMIRAQIPGPSSHAADKIFYLYRSAENLQGCSKLNNCSKIIDSAWNQNKTISLIRLLWQSPTNGL